MEEFAISVKEPNLPELWDYDDSVEKTKGNIYSWKNMTLEIAEELWVARKMLNSQGERTDLTSEQKFQSWTQYCEDIGYSRQVVNRWLKQWYEPEKIVHVSQNSGENEWYTPQHYIESARNVMGSIDVDPASSDFANEIVNAESYYTIETNGLDKTWEGNVWLNPPYSQPQVSDFSDKVIEQLERFGQAVVLVNNATETVWLQNMMLKCDSICFIKGRIKYLDQTGEPKNTPLQGQVILYFGDDVDEFINEFQQYGICLIQRKKEGI